VYGYTCEFQSLRVSDPEKKGLAIIFFRGCLERTPRNQSFRVLDSGVNSQSKLVLLFHFCQRQLKFDEKHDFDSYSGFTTNLYTKNVAEQILVVSRFGCHLSRELLVPISMPHGGQSQHQSNGDACCPPPSSPNMVLYHSLLRYFAGALCNKQSL
jgi:hypothetical protein